MGTTNEIWNLNQPSMQRKCLSNEVENNGLLISITIIGVVLTVVVIC